MEKKKIQAKPKLSAEAQEEMLQRLQQGTEKSINLQQVNEIPVNLQQKVENAPIVQQKVEIAPIVQQSTAVAVNPTIATKQATVNIQENTAFAVKERNNTASAEKSGKIQRITVDMPIELYEKMKDEVEDNGQTIKGFIVNLVKYHFQKNKA
jgi:hypothetical protein